MDGTFDEIVWSPQAERDLDDILEYYLEQKSEKAHQHILDILDETASLIFSEQWQIDEFDASCRRIIVKKKFRVLYKVLDTTILITRVYSTKMDSKEI